MNFKPPLEKEIQNTICEYLFDIKRYFGWRQNTNPIFDRTKATMRKMPKYSKNGVSDIILVKDGTFIGLEVKRPSGRQSEGQKAFQKELEAAGGKYHLVTSLDDVLKLGL